MLIWGGGTERGWGNFRLQEKQSRVEVVRHTVWANNAGCGAWLRQMNVDRVKRETESRLSNVGPKAQSFFSEMGSY